MPTADEIQEKDSARKRYEHSTYVMLHVFRFEPNRDLRISVDEGEHLTGVPASTIRNYIGGTSCPPVEFIKSLYQARPHPLLKELLEPEGWRLEPAGEKSSVLPTVSDHLLEVVDQVAEFRRMFEQFYADEHLDSTEMRELHTRLGLMEAEVHRLHDKIHQTAKGKKQ